MIARRCGGSFGTSCTLFRNQCDSGIEATKPIKLESPSTAVIGLTAGVPDDTEKAMLNVGAVAVLDKAGLLQTPHLTIVEAVNGQNFCPG